MTWIHPLSLFGCLAIGIPIYLHLRGRRPKKTTNFPPIEFLKLAIQTRKKTQSHARVTPNGLPGSLFLVCHCCHGPSRCSLTNRKPPQQGKDFFIVFDNSLSMRSKIDSEYADHSCKTPSQYFSRFDEPVGPSSVLYDCADKQIFSRPNK